jgi:hypothetical protein
VWLLERFALSQMTRNKTLQTEMSTLTVRVLRRGRTKY